MDKKTLKALNGSIRKWQAIVKGTGRDYGIDNCPLCKLFYYNGPVAPRRCNGCPVRKKTGRPYCWESPYEKWSDLGVYTTIEDIKEPERREAVRTLAKNELEFLKSLRPKKHKTR
jgi:hypothetical protein